MSEFKLGMKTESEHKNVIGDDLKKRAKIVKAHLKENPKYYSLLKKIIERKSE